MRLEISIPQGLQMSSRFCWVCGKLGKTNGVSIICCYEHPEGVVQWSVYEKPQRVMPSAGKIYI